MPKRVELVFAVSDSDPSTPRWSVGLGNFSLSLPWATLAGAELLLLADI